MTNDSSELEILENRNLELEMRIGRYEQQLRRMSIINDIAEAANGTTIPNEAIKTTLTRICHDTDWPVGHAFVVDTSQEEVRLISSGVWYLSEYDRFDALVSYTKKLSLRKGEGLPGIVYQDQEALWANAIKSDAKRFALVRKMGLQSTFGFPIMIGNEVTAVLELFSERNIAPDEIVLDTVAQLGMLLGRVFERRRAIDNSEALNEKLVTTSRRAGMAEVASGVLHNVGNILNSITVSTALLQDALESTSIGGVSKIAELLGQHSDNLSEFFAADAKGQKMLPYLETLSNQLDKEQYVYKLELASLLDNVNHVKNVILRQQHYAKPTSIKEPANINSLVEDSLKMNNLHSTNHRIKVIRDFAELPEILLDKHDCIQILNNLIDNAKQALDSNPSNPCITISTKTIDEQQHAELSVEDNGCGISTNVQNQIFQFGFTTKENGHGFGLHTSANTAKSMDGNLSFYSEGENKGTTFKLTLPLAIDILGEGDITT